VIDRYELLDRHFSTKYRMSFEEFRAQNMVANHDYSFEVESDYCDWEMAVTGLAALKAQIARPEAYGNTQEEDAEMDDFLKPLPCVRVYTDANGESHFSDEWITLALADFAPPAPPMAVAAPKKAGTVTFISAPSGWFGDLHPAPRRQFMFALAGELEVQVSDGEVRRYKTGEIALLEDTFGKGHASRVVSSELAVMAVVSLPDQ